MWTNQIQKYLNFVSLKYNTILVRVFHLFEIRLMKYVALLLSYSCTSSQIHNILVMDPEIKTRREAIDFYLQVE